MWQAEKFAALNYRIQNLGEQFFYAKIFLRQNFFTPKFFYAKKTHFFTPKSFFYAKTFLRQKRDPENLRGMEVEVQRAVPNFPHQCYPRIKPNYSTRT